MKKHIKQPTSFANRYGESRGFTLVELLVSLGLFAVVVIAAIGCLYTINQSSIKVNGMRIVLDNLNFATESMSRTIRTGSDIVCGGAPLSKHGGEANCPFVSGNTGSSEISFNSTLGTNEALDYRLVNGQIFKCPINGPSGTPNDGDSLTGSVDVGNCVSITAPEITVQNLTFYVDGADSNDTKQPSIIMLMQGVANAGANNVAPFSIQTYISQRAGE